MKVRDRGGATVSGAASAAACYIPAAVLSLSLLVDPLLNIGPVDEHDFGRADLQETKSTALLQAFVPLLFCASVVCAMLSRCAVPERGSAVIWPLAAFLSLAIVSSSWALNPSYTLSIAAYQALLCATLGLSTFAAREPERVLDVVFWTLAAAVVVNLAAVALRPAGLIGHQGIYQYKNTLGGAAGLALVVAICRFRSGGLLQQLAAVGTTAGAVLLLAASESKTPAGLALLAPAAGCALYLLASRGGTNPVAATALTGGILIPAYLLAAEVFRFDTADAMRLAFGDETFTGRTVLWEFLWPHAMEDPLRGYGYRGFWGIGPESPKYRATVEFINVTGSGHNGFLDTLVELGFQGLALYLVYVLATLSACGRIASRPPGMSLLFLSVAVFVIGRNMMESVILWATQFDALLFVLTSFLALRPVPPTKPGRVER